MKKASKKQKEENSRLKEENSKQKEENKKLQQQVSPSTVGLKLLDSSTIESFERCNEVGSGGGSGVYKVYKKEA